MKKQKRIFGKKRGFTLVELLVVIVIIGILSGLLMVSAGGALDKAEATKIVSDLKNIQSASVLYFADKDVWPSGDITEINSYLSVKLEAGGSYSLINEGAVIKARYSNPEAGTGLMVKLKAMQDKGSPISVDVLGKSAELAVHN